MECGRAFPRDGWMADDPRAEVRRRHLRAFMDESGLEVAAWARHAKVSSSSLYNFLNGRSDSLSQRILEKLAKSKNVTVSRLIGERAEQSELRLPLIKIIGEVEAGAWRTVEALYYEDQEVLAIPVQKQYASRAFGLRVRGPSMNKVYPEGTVLVCVRLPEFDEAVLPGDRVVVHRRSDNDTIEATVKEIERDANGGWWLWPRSKHPHFQTPIAVPNPDDWALTSQGDEIYVFAVVIGSLRPERAGGSSTF
jgi:repressor LexA